MFVTGISWIREKEHGTSFRGMRGRHADWRGLYKDLREHKIIPAAIDAFGRFDTESKRACLCVSLAMYDAMIEPRGAEAAVTGLLVAGTAGAREANLAYFRDYIAAGRTLGRGNLFVYTLPTSPGAEAAIAFGCRGPLLYVGRTGKNRSGVLHDAAGFVSAGYADSMLCLVANRHTMVCNVIQREKNARQTGLPLEMIAAETDSGIIPTPDGDREASP